jgi:hypothetical protein
MYLSQVQEQTLGRNGRRQAATGNDQVVQALWALFASVCVRSRKDAMSRIGWDTLQRIKGWIGSLTEIGLMLLALAIVAALLVGANLPFFGNVTNNIMALVKGLGDAGLVGLITLGVILWLFSGRKVA